MSGSSTKRVLEEGRVVSIEGTIARISFDMEKDRDKCKKCGSCVPIVKGGPLVLQAETIAGIEKDDRVIVEVFLPSSSWRSLLHLAVSILFFIVGAFLGSWAGGTLEAKPSVTEGLTFLGGFLFISFAFLLIYFNDRRWRKKHRPVIVKKVDSPGPVS